MKTILSIEGMTCGNCAKHVEKALQSVDGVEAVTVDLAGKKATVAHGDEVTVDALTAAVEEEGYRALPIV